jgi:hypothetical protein
MTRRSVLSSSSMGSLLTSAVTEWIVPVKVKGDA